MRFTLREIILTGLFAALTAVFAQISIPIPISPVPITLSIFGVFLSAIILGLKCGTFSQITYVLMGIFGLPVFAGFSSGLNYKAGYILSYPVIALIIGLIMKRKKSVSIMDMMGMMVIGLIVCYAMGATVLALVLRYDAAKAIALGVVPFLPLDILKIVVAAVIGYKIRVSLINARLINES